MSFILKTEVLLHPVFTVGENRSLQKSWSEGLSDSHSSCEKSHQSYLMQIYWALPFDLRLNHI